MEDYLSLRNTKETSNTSIKRYYYPPTKLWEGNILVVSVCPRPYVTTHGPVQTRALGEQTTSPLPPALATARTGHVQSSTWTTPYGGVLVSVNFGCFSWSGFAHFHCNAMRKAIKVHNNLHTNQQNEHTTGTSTPTPPPSEQVQTCTGWKADGWPTTERTSCLWIKLKLISWKFHKAVAGLFLFKCSRRFLSWHHYCLNITQ